VPQTSPPRCPDPDPPEDTVKEPITTAASPSPIGPYSQAIRSETLLLVSGQGPLDPATGRMPEGVEAQTHQVLRNIRGILEAGGASMDDVLKVTAHLADLADFDVFNRVYSEYFRPPYPVRTTVGSQLLGILVEIDVVANAPAAAVR
jgi:reactive intermediate/imine deaminase